MKTRALRTELLTELPEAVAAATVRAVRADDELKRAGRRVAWRP